MEERLDPMWYSWRLRFVALLVSSIPMPALPGEGMLIIDDRSTGDLRSTLGREWRLVTDDVMGGVSQGRLTIDTIDGRACLRLQGNVSLENRGGFVQAALDLSGDGAFDASGYGGVLLDVHGNNETYNVHLRTTELWLPWQSYRASFTAPARWQTVRLPFGRFEAYRTGSPFDPARLRRVGIVAIGRAFAADVCIARVALYRTLREP